MQLVLTIGLFLLSILVSARKFPPINEFRVNGETVYRKGEMENTALSILFRTSDPNILLLVPKYKREKEQAKRKRYHWSQNARRHCYESLNMLQGHLPTQQNDREVLLIHIQPKALKANQLVNYGQIKTLSNVWEYGKALKTLLKKIKKNVIIHGHLKPSKIFFYNNDKVIAQV
jgi:hypothetical protein